MPRVLVLSNPRSGSTFFQELLNCHPEVETDTELLNDENEIIVNPLEYIQSELASLTKTFVGFKVFPEQMHFHSVNFGELVQAVGVTHVIVLWRESILESLASRQIADTNGEWYSEKKSTTVRHTQVDQEDLKKYIKKLTSEWNQIGSDWPVDVRPIFVKYEDLIQNPVEEVKRVLAEMSLASDHVSFHHQAQRQNPAPIEKKVTNFYQLPKELREAKLDVSKILLDKINTSLQIPQELLQYAPDREPCMPPGGWRYRVAEPYLPSIAKQNVFDAIHSGSISSAGYWPREMGKKLRALFRCPVAQPCSNGFSALLLAMQVANIKEDDEVIVPSMTMVAVPNAIYYLRATPVFADNAKESYNPSWAEYERVASPKTKAIVVTHTYGVPAVDIEEIEKNCKAKGWVLIEDISECVGITCLTNSGEERLLGTFGDFAIASLYANKIIHGGDGGFIIAKEAKVGKRLASIVNHGFTPSFHFVHFETAPNAKIHGIGAAMASGCLDEIKAIMKHRSLIARLYRDKLHEVPVKLMPKCGAQDTPWVFGLQCQSKSERTKLRAFLAKHGIETRDFFFSLHLQPAYFKQGTKDGMPLKPASLPNAELLGSTGFYLPTHSNLIEKDIEYICNAMKLYFNGNEGQLDEVFPIYKPPKVGLQVETDGFALQVRSYRDSGELLRSTSRDHIYLEAVKLGFLIDEALFHERFDHVQKLLSEIKQMLTEASEDPLFNNMKNYFGTYVNYFESQIPLEQPCQRPWLTINLNNELYQHSKNIPTTTDPETLQLLIYLVEQHKPETIWEIGSWMGHATALISEVCSSLNLGHRVFACDAFKWQAWMRFYLPDDMKVKDETSFLEVFKANVEPCLENIEPVEWSYDIPKLPTVLENQKPNLVFLDITQEDDDLEHIWHLIKPNLIPDKTIILFNGLAPSSIPFFTRHAHELRGFAKPNTLAKAFLFVTPTPSNPESEEEKDSYEEVVEMMKELLPLQRTMNFYSNPGWDHHHRDLFCRSIDLLKSRMHSNDGQILFVPAVEETMCDDPEIFYSNSWIGIIHSVEHHPELFYTPDLARLCTKPNYIAALKYCRGLYTLTKFQSEYLKKHLPKNLPKFPIQNLTYPTEMIEDMKPSRVPEMMRNGEKVDLLHIGSFARDYAFFFEVQIPTSSNFQKVLVAGDEFSQNMSEKYASKDVIVTGRLSAEEYEEKLATSIAFLTLKYEGAANTLILECIARNVPILSPNFSSCTEYLGEEYPLFYDPSKPDEISLLLTEENVNKAISYLKAMDKSQFSQEKFLQDVEEGAVMLSIPPSSDVQFSPDPLAKMMPQNARKFPSYDVTICICSYKRTHHLSKLLESLWEKQDFTGSYQIIIWNNNDSRNGLVRKETMKYIQQSNDKRALELISSVENYYCSIRFAMPALMKSDCLLICDDDIIPGANFISFFYAAHISNPKDVLCVRGHEFLPHTLDPHNPMKVWMEYDNIRFRNDDQPEQLIHFVHADACLIPKEALQEIASVTMPDASYALVDDYWMSYILNHKFGRNLRKLSVAGLSQNPVLRTDDSDKLGLALHTRPEVQDARLRLYVHHMLNDWPTWETAYPCQTVAIQDATINSIKEKKELYWNLPPQIGFNVSSSLSKQDIADLTHTGAKSVRIGAVGVGGKTFFELSEFLTEPEEQLKRLEETISSLAEVGINVIITLERRLASERIWKMIAEKFATFENVVGYDLINEPFTDHEKDLHWADVATDHNDPDLPKIEAKLMNIIHSIRSVDKFTTIILEPTFWGRIESLSKFPIDKFLKIDSNIVFSVHFYDPMLLTSRVRNKGKYSFPCSVPWYDDIKHSEETYWDDEAILKKLKMAKTWAEAKGVHIILAEFGICRDIGGAAEYLKAVMSACKTLSFSGFLFSFRDPDWEAMDYEFGPEYDSFTRHNNNTLMNEVLAGIADMNNI